MPYSLGQAISTNYQVPQSDIAGALGRGFQLEEQARAKREAERLKREMQAAREDAAFDKALSSIDFKDLHPYVLPKVQREVAPLIAEATKLYQQDKRKNHILINQKLQEAQNRVYAGKSLSENVKGFVNEDEKFLSGAARAAKKNLMEVGDIEALNGMKDPITGEGIINNQIRFNKNDYADIRKVTDDVLQNVAMNITKENNLGNNQREFRYGITEKIASKAAEGLWADPRIRDKFIDENRDYILGKYYDGVPEKMRSTSLLASDENIQADLYEKFRRQTVKASEKFGKGVMDAIPQPRKDNYSGPYNYANKEFNPGFASPRNHIDAYVKSGAITKQEADYFRKAERENPNATENALRLPDIISIDPPNTGTYTLKDENGKNIKTDNIRLVYVPKTKKGGGQWFLSGSSVDDFGDQVSVDIPVNEKTYGNIFSVYGKMSQDDVVDLLNRRMKDGGITNDRFKLDLSPKQTLPITKGRFPLPTGKPKSVKQNGVVYTWNERTGKYE